MNTIDLNADVGEGFGDEPLYALVSSVNVACGAHAGDAASMAAAVDAALAAGCAIGAHPGYADRASMGRRPQMLAPHDLTTLLLDQVRTLEAIAASGGARLTHVKPHGALYNRAAVDAACARAVADAVAVAGSSLALYALAGSALADAGRAAGVPVIEEAFCDRGYRADGTLVPRDEAGALVADPGAAAAQAVALARGDPVATIGGGSIRVRAGTLCLHADTPGAVANARAVRAALDDAGIVVAAPGRVGEPGR